MKAVNPPPTPSALRRWGPLAGVLAALVAVAVMVLVVDPPGDPDAVAASEQAANDESFDLPEGVMPYSVAEAAGTAADIDWGDGCDTEAGVLALPMSPAAECFEPFTGENDGATTTGVTADSIKVVLYLPQPNDPVLEFVYDQIGLSDTNEDTIATFEGFADMYGEYYETYGRKLELVPYVATGTALDAVAATTDAETIARDLEPFMVIGGPAFGTAFADTLAANEVMCSGCAQSTETQFYLDRAPYVWSITTNRDQDSGQTAEYIGRRLAGGNAEYGGPDVQDDERVFGYIHVATLDAEADLRQRFEDQLAEFGVEFADVASYDDPLSLAGQSREILARMKDRGVTSIVFRGDPLAPQTLTEQATQQDYFPEWVLSGSILVDTTIFGRTYDQAQWRHAFGPSSLAARVSPDVAGSGYLYRWFWDEPPPAASSAIIAPSLQFLFGVIQGMGPTITPEAFQATIFASPVIEGSVIAPQVSWGDHGFWPETDYSGIDDQVEIWWDPDATGPDEIGGEGTGMWAYANGGRRYLPGEWPDDAATVFAQDPDPVTLYTDLPEGVTLPEYEPLPRPG